MNIMKLVRRTESGISDPRKRSSRSLVSSFFPAENSNSFISTAVITFRTCRASRLIAQSYIPKYSRDKEIKRAQKKLEDRKSVV